MKTIIIKSKTGPFAENKDIARDIRTRDIIPALEKGETEIVLDFAGVTGAAQSFIQQVVNIVADYMEASY